MLKLRIIDILDVHLNLKTIVPIEPNTEMNITISKMKYNSLRLSIPIYWKQIIKDITNTPIGETRLNDKPCIKINNILKPLTKCTNKHIYHKLLYRANIG